MVALAPITNETSPWDVLDTFPKLHSRARETITTSCTEVPHSKSLCRVEIWLTIYESCVGLESFTRDPIGFEGSPWNLYESLASTPLIAVDHDGLLSDNPACERRFCPIRPIPPNGPKRCVFYASPFKPGVAGIDTIPLNGGVLLPFTDKDSIIFNIMKHGCCEVMFAGHQGGSANGGGVKGMITCPATDNFGERLAKAFKMAGCGGKGGCSLTLAACGSTSPAANDCRQTLANESGCNVFGSPETIPYYDPSDPNGGPYDFKPCTLDPKKVGETCGNPIFPDSKYRSWPFVKYNPVLN